MAEDSVERAIFYPTLKGKTHKELHQIAFEEIAQTTNLASELARKACEFLWADWQKPANLKTTLYQLYEIVGDFDWKWFDKWDVYFSEKGKYPHTWANYRKKRQITTGEIKVALFYHSIHARFAVLRRYESHYGILEDCTWSAIRYDLKLDFLDDKVEAEVIDLIQPIKDNQLLILPPYFPAGRADVIYERLRNRS
ncbi:hypothetical protein HYE59_07585 [Aggregatibacter actinomycetemcomitans]|uniref:hypothetical protein n=1 Tax=Aggregatibacter actinomycetemcomitans TaxID=714 RepID=UPI00197C2574|nr:hypothetical protein [Aggregatibacter actinomycetemcomitans]MBN6077394.1 hypothetical protein [Aggregatibacter actinomycetemcomitans]